jgi:hypothetical protein
MDGISHDHERRRKIMMRSIVFTTMLLLGAPAASSL